MGAAPLRQRIRVGNRVDPACFEAWAREVIKRLQGVGNFREFDNAREADGVDRVCVKAIADTLEEMWLGVALAALDADPAVRRLSRVLLITAVYLAPSNWYESLEMMRILDRVKRHLPPRYVDAMNRVLVREP